MPAAAGQVIRVPAAAGQMITEQAVMIECGGRNWRDTIVNKIAAMQDVSDLSNLVTTLIDSLGAGGF